MPDNWAPSGAEWPNGTIETVTRRIRPFAGHDGWLLVDYTYDPPATWHADTRAAAVALAATNPPPRCQRHGVPLAPWTTKPLGESAWDCPATNVVPITPDTDMYTHPSLGCSVHYARPEGTSR